MCLPGLDALYLTRMVTMSNSFPSVPDAAARFFDNYLNCLDKASIPQQRQR